MSDVKMRGQIERKERLICEQNFIIVSTKRLFTINEKALQTLCVYV